MICRRQLGLGGIDIRDAKRNFTNDRRVCDTYTVNRKTTNMFWSFLPQNPADFNKI